VENGTKINLGKIKSIIFKSAQVKNPPGYCLGEQKFGKQAVVNTRGYS